MFTPVHRPFYLVGPAFSCALAGMILYVSPFTFRADLALQHRFWVSFSAEVIAVLIFLPTLIIDDAIKAGKLTLPKRIKRRLSDATYLISFVLAILGAISLYEEGENFLMIMMLSLYPSLLLGLVCIYALIGSFIFRPTDQK